MIKEDRLLKRLIYVLLVLVISSSVYAKECHLAEGGKGGTITLTGGAPGSAQMFLPTDWTGGHSYFSELSYFNPNLDHELWSYCDAGNDGYDLYAYTNKASAESATDGRALFPTNIEGIYYAVKFYSSAGGGYFPSTTNIWTVIDSSSTPKWDALPWKVTVTLYQIQYFQGNTANVAYITPKDSRTLGQMRLGEADSDDNNPWSINVTPSSFKIPIVAATCSTAVAGNGTNNVDFGDVMFSSLRENYWATKSFDLKLSGCTNTVWVRFKLSSTKAENANGYYQLTNTLTGSNAAQGVGVAIQSNFLTTNGEGAWLTSGTALMAPSASVNYTQTYTYNFTAMFQRTGAALKAGQFKAIGTFTMDYF